MTFEIWQAPAKHSLLGAYITGYDPAWEYQKVWEQRFVLEISSERLLALIWANFQRINENNMPPDEYTGRSLSMGDLVRIGQEWWYCASVGWKRVEAPASAV